MQTRVGGLLVVTGATLVFVLAASWAVVIGAGLLVVGGIILAIAVEPALRLEQQAVRREPRGRSTHGNRAA